MRKHRKTLVAGAALVIAAAAYIGCGGDDSSPQGPPGPSADVTVDIVARNGSNSYSPNPATVQVGQTIAWHNANSQIHTATGNGDEFDTGNIAPGGTSGTRTFSAPDTIPYHCEPHPDMIGTLIVTP